LAGVSQAEASALRWSGIDEKRNEILYTRQKTRKPFKTPIYGWLKPLILRLKASRKEGGDAKVFAIREVKHAIATACRTLGYSHFTHPLADSVYDHSTAYICPLFHITQHSPV
jgi:hypothetical protein